MNWKSNLTLVLVESRNPLNIGAAARAMLNFGFTRLALAAPYDLAFREARSAPGAGAVLRSATVHASLAEAVAIKDGRIVGVGASGEIRALAGPRTELIDLGGRMVLPGLIDSHCHPYMYGLRQLKVNLMECRPACGH